MTPENEEPRKISFRPYKRFFIDSITRDIDLEDAILDLIDNSIDGFFRSRQKENARIIIKFDSSKFIIEDNCGGITKELVYDKIFRIGPPSEKQRTKLGVFGVGLKRAMFKMGQDIKVESDDGRDYYVIHLDKEWLDSDEIWDTEFADGGKSKGKRFFKLTIEELHPGVSEAFGSNVFQENVRDLIRNVHSIYLSKKIRITVNGRQIEPLSFQFLDDGETFKVYRKKFEYDGIKAEIVAGFSKEGLKRRKEIPRTYGWYIFCNDRIVLANDTSSRTGFFDDRDSIYHHFQDSRILGLAFFESEDPTKLPWRTTKGDINPENKIYRALQREMRNVTSQLMTLTRGVYAVADPDTGETIGQSIYEGVDSKDWREIPFEQSLLFPEIKGIPVRERKTVYTSVQYQVKKVKMRAVKRKMGNTALSNKDVGLKTFNYYCRLEKVE